MRGLAIAIAALVCEAREASLHKSADVLAGLLARLPVFRSTALEHEAQHLRQWALHLEFRAAELTRASALHRRAADLLSEAARKDAA